MRTRNLFRSVFEAAPDAMFIFDEDGGFLQANRAASRLLGLSQNKLKAVGIQVLLGGAKNQPDWRGLFRNQELECELQLGGLRGRTRILGLRAQRDIVPGRHLLVVQDITGRKQVEENLKNQAMMLDFADDTIMIRDLNDEILYWNQGAERFYGWKKSEAIGQYVHGFLKTRFPAPLKEIRETVFRDGYWEGMLVHSKRNGERVRVDSRWTLQRNSDGSPVAFLEINNDITERVRAEEELRRARDELEMRVIERTQELSRANVRLKALSAQLISAQEEERRRISRDLHDDLGQVLTAISLDLQRILRGHDPAKLHTILQNVISANEEARSRLREISALLRPPVLDDVGLKEAIQTSASEFSERTGIPVRLQLRFQNRELHDAACTSLYRIVQEALTNVSRHARAKAVTIRMEVRDGSVQLKIQDDGVGFDLNSVRIDKSLGLLGIRERAELLGGTFQIHSSSAERTTALHITIPLEQKPDLHPESALKA